MKTLRLLALVVAVCTVAACDDDDTQMQGNSPVNPAFAGTYNLTMVTAPDFVDFNMDGTANADMMLESPCYNNSSITLKADGTYEQVNNTVLHESETGCFSETLTGEWEIDGSDLMLTNTTLEPPLTTEHDITENQIQVVLGNGNYPVRDADNNPAYSTGMVTYTYTKVQ